MGLGESRSTRQGFQGTIVVNELESAGYRLVLVIWRGCMVETLAAADADPYTGDEMRSLDSTTTAGAGNVIRST